MRAKGIVPAAGIGSRMNMAYNESKEMLLDSFGKPIIQWSFDLCKKYNIEPLVVTRIEKSDLIEYCIKQGVDTQIIKPFGDWPDTIIQSDINWTENNLLILPDTRFNPQHVVHELISDLENGCQYSIGVHNVVDISKWCVISDYSLIEKPNQIDPGVAMGLIAFKGEAGRGLFKTISKRDRAFKLSDCGFHYLNEFTDITRTGKIEV